MLATCMDLNQATLISQTNLSFPASKSFSKDIMWPWLHLEQPVGSDHGERMQMTHACSLEHLAKVCTGSGKTTTLEGSRGKESLPSTVKGDGIVHLAIDELFQHLHWKAAAVGR